MVDSFTGKFRFLSNFYPSPLTYQGDRFPTVEHAFQAVKTFDAKEKTKVQNARTPGEAKSLGKTVSLRSDWEDIKFGVMKDLLRIKFEDPSLRQLLLDTGDQSLIEGNSWGDTFWGVSGGKGQNHLGRLLMEVRAELR